MQRDEKPMIGLQRQLVTCTVMSGLAVVLLLLFQRTPYWPVLLSGMPFSYQIAIGLGLGGAYWAAAAIGYRFAAGRKSTEHMAASYGRVDLSGWNPLWIALAAGFGEELLFRGALQPLVGIWVTSALFVVAHVRAYRFNELSTRVLLQAAGLFAVSLVLGGVRQYVGLAAVMIVHAAMDIVGLYTVRRMVQPNALAAT